MESRTQGLFAELLEGARALEERPGLEAKIADAEAASARANAAAKFAEERYAALAADYDRIKAELAAKEAELAHATFREKEAGDKLAVLVGAFKSVNREINETVELVAPEPKSEPVPTPEPTSTTSTTAGESSTDLPGVYPWDQGMIPDTYNEPTATDVASDKTTEVAVTPQEGPTSDTSASTIGMTTPTADTSVFKPYADKPYWLKPDSLSWRDWTNGGGDRAPWLKDGDDLNYSPF